MEIRNAKIKFSYLGLDDILTFQLGFECGESKPFVTDKIPANTPNIVCLLSVLDLRSWEELPRKFARIKIENNKIVAIGNLIENRWVDLK